MTGTKETEAQVAELRRLQNENWPAGVTREVRYRLGRKPVAHYLRHEAQSRPDAVMIRFYGRSLSWAEIDDLSDRFAALLQRYGVGVGDRVGLMMGNCPQYVICFLGIMKLGAVLSPVNPMFKGDELTYQLTDGGVEILVAQDDLIPLVTSVQGETSLRVVLATGLGEMAGDAVSDAAGPDMAPAPGIERLMDVLQDTAPFAGTDFDDLDAPAALNYTGGTTGLPKGCVHTQGDMIYTLAAYCTVAMPEVGPSDGIVSFIPMFWIAGEDLGLLMPVYTGASLCLMTRWNAEDWMAAVSDLGGTVSVLPVDCAVEIMTRPDLGKYDMSGLKFVGAMSLINKLTRDYRAQWRDLIGTTLVEASYGMTESHTLDTFTIGMQDDDYDLEQNPVFIGFPVPGTDIIIRDFDTGALKPIGAHGEICIRSPSILKSYWNKPGVTAQALRDGWLHTGDIGMLNEKGQVHYLGRNKEMLKVRGMAVFPAEIEMALGRHNAVLGSAVIGRADDTRGEVPVAFVRLDPALASAWDAEALTSWCKEKMAGYKVPEIRLIDAFPMTTTGKIRKVDLAAML